ncbi:MAG: hypothetical protein E7391_05945 [Ruminococcaceae bacterium]|nr:hypothetical protein [Oscillospiraceae bacterium]
MDKVSQLLENKDAMSEISKMFSNNTPQGNEIEMAEKISQMTRKLNEPDPKINLLYALKPYMNPSRTNQIDKAIKMIQMTKISGFFKDI